MKQRGNPGAARALVKVTDDWTPIPNLEYRIAGVLFTAPRWDVGERRVMASFDEEEVVPVIVVSVTRIDDSSVGDSDRQWLRSQLSAEFEWDERLTMRTPIFAPQKIIKFFGKVPRKVVVESSDQ